MRLLTSIILLLFGAMSFCQENSLIKLAFQDHSNFDITTRLGNKKPTVYYVLHNTDKWNTYRFHLDDDLTSDSVRKQLESDEHSPYNHSYLFSDTALDRLFSDTEKLHLYRVAQLVKPRQLIDTFKLFRLINTFKAVKKGFFFSVTDPIFTQDKQYAFIDITTFKKDKETKELNNAYFAKTLLIYQNVRGKGWKRIKKIDYLIL